MLRLYVAARSRWQPHRDRLIRLLRRDGGYSTETAVWTALLATAAIAVAAIIVSKVTAKANSIDLDAVP